MAGPIVLNTTFTDTTLPVNQTYDQRIGQRSEVIGWWVPDASRLTLNSGRVASWAGRSAAGRTASQATAGKQPLYNASVAAINNRPSVSFDRTRADYLATDAVVPTSVYTKVALVRMTSEPTTNQFHDIMSGGTGVSSSVASHRMAFVGVDKFQSRVGTTTTITTYGTNTVAGYSEAWHLIMSMWDATATQTGMSIDGAAFAKSTPVVGAVITDQTLQLGAHGNAFNMQGQIADAMLLNVDLSASGNAALLATIKQYYRDRYGITVA